MKFLRAKQDGEIILEKFRSTGVPVFMMLDTVKRLSGQTLVGTCLFEKISFKFGHLNFFKFSFSVEPAKKISVFSESITLQGKLKDIKKGVLNADIHGKRSVMIDYLNTLFEFVQLRGS